MRANRYVRTTGRLLFLLLLTAAVLLAPAPRLTLTTAATPAPTAMDDGAPSGPDVDVPAVGRAWPVGLRPRVLRGWEPPATPYGPGHRGIDLAAQPGTPVRAVAAGRVSFAGRVAGRGVVSVELAGTGAPPLRTTYEPVRASVRKGDEVAAGKVVGALEATGSHCDVTCLHWGLRSGDAYLDPLSLLPPWLLHRGPSRLLPVLRVPLPA
ncbi:murein hydrolase activator EnvC family protein [Streptomyces sp. NPDC049627]|uniref:murein hydrolase activator EnvC family protein n=1 Tax=Streptomyces sp. NPDC049627 TaxID=3365595 RepID=UPI0037AA5961